MALFRCSGGNGGAELTLSEKVSSSLAYTATEKGAYIAFAIAYTEKSINLAKPVFTTSGQVVALSDVVTGRSTGFGAMTASSGLTISAAGGFAVINLSAGDTISVSWSGETSLKTQAYRVYKLS